MFDALPPSVKSPDVLKAIDWPVLLSYAPGLNTIYVTFAASNVRLAIAF